MWDHVTRKQITLSVETVSHLSIFWFSFHHVDILFLKGYTGGFLGCSSKDNLLDCTVRDLLVNRFFFFEFLHLPFKLIFTKKVPHIQEDSLVGHVELHWPNVITLVSSTMLPLQLLFVMEETVEVLLDKVLITILLSSNVYWREDQSSFMEVSISKFSCFLFFFTKFNTLLLLQEKHQNWKKLYRRNLW